MVFTQQCHGFAPPECSIACKAPCSGFHRFGSSKASDRRTRDRSLSFLNASVNVTSQRIECRYDVRWWWNLVDVSGVQGRQTSAQDATHMAVTNWFLFLLQVLLLLVYYYRSFHAARAAVLVPEHPCYHNNVGSFMNADALQEMFRKFYG